MLPNQTKKHAFERVLDARMGSIGPEATDEYLEALLLEIEKWKDRVQEEMANRVAKARALDDCDYLYEGPGGISDREDFHSDG